MIVINMSEDKKKGSIFTKLKEIIFGPPRDLGDTGLFHKISLVPLLAWIGLGSDGLSSSAYGPGEAYRALGEHTYLAIFLALGTAITIFIISACYSKIIEHFPHGGGGYVVATHTLGEIPGLVSGSALLVDYVLTISVSIASCGDAIFSFLDPSLHHLKLPFEISIILLLIILNIRGVKESITFLAPIFVTFVVTHILLIGVGILEHVNYADVVAKSIKSNLDTNLKTLGLLGVLAIYFKAFSIGAGTFTGLEAVSNGLPTLREPKVENGKKTMKYMATSLAFTACGLYTCYLLYDLKPVEGMTLNSVLANNVFTIFGDIGRLVAFITILSEGALLIVAAQTGFIDGPRVMANMAKDSWLPHMFINLSDRLTLKNGTLIVGFLALAILWYTHGNISILVVMYSVNVFITFTLSISGLAKRTFQNRKSEKNWKRDLLIEIPGAILCFAILVIALYEKFTHGAWLTVLITGGLIILCVLVRRHYDKVRRYIRDLNIKFRDVIVEINRQNLEEVKPDTLDKNLPTCVLLVSDFNGLGIYTLLAINRDFPNVFKNVIFVSVGVVDSGAFKGIEKLKELEKKTVDSLKKYVILARRLGFKADYRYKIHTDVVEGAVDIIMELKREFPHLTVFSGQLVFKVEKFYHRLLHNQTSFAIERKLYLEGITTVVLPIRIDFEIDEMKELINNLPEK